MSDTVETLRKAAEKLRTEYMGTVGPDVGLALADWLDHEAAIREHNLKKWTIFTRNWVVQSHFADPVARAVLGDS